MDEMNVLSRGWKWTLAIGIVSTVLGVLAFAMPVASTVGVTITVGALLMVGGATRLIHAFKHKGTQGNGMRFLQAVAALVSGALMLRYVDAGMVAISIALSFYFFASAASQWGVTAALRPYRSSGLGMASSVASFFLGAFILFTFPISALWIPGTLLGIDLMFSGIAMIGLAFTLRKLRPEARQEERPEMKRAA